MLFATFVLCCSLPLFALLAPNRQEEDRKRSVGTSQRLPSLPIQGNGTECKCQLMSILRQAAKVFAMILRLLAASVLRAIFARLECVPAASFSPENTGTLAVRRVYRAYEGYEVQFYCFALLLRDYCRAQQIQTLQGRLRKKESVEKSREESFEVLSFSVRLQIGNLERKVEKLVEELRKERPQKGASDVGVVEAHKDVQQNIEFTHSETSRMEDEILVQEVEGYCVKIAEKEEINVEKDNQKTRKSVIVPGVTADGYCMFCWRLGHSSKWCRQNPWADPPPEPKTLSEPKLN